MYTFSQKEQVILETACFVRHLLGLTKQVRVSQLVGQLCFSFGGVNIADDDRPFM